MLNGVCSSGMPQYVFVFSMLSHFWEGNDDDGDGDSGGKNPDLTQPHPTHAGFSKLFRQNLHSDIRMCLGIDGSWGYWGIG